VSADEAVAIVQQRCVPCHSTNPSREGYDTAPAGIVLDTQQEIVDRADAIEEQAVRTKAMPLGNATGMTDEERQTLGAWLESLK
jgi:uncharacterized membrane protein